MEVFHLLVFGGILVIRAALGLLRNNRVQISISSAFNSVKHGFLVLYYLMIIGDLLEWRCVFYLGTTCGLGKGEIFLFLCAGFVPYMLFGEIVGLFTHRQDLKRGLLVITCTLSCITLQPSQDRSMIGCILGGIIISFFSAYHSLLAPSLDNFLQPGVVYPNFPIREWERKNDLMSHRVDRNKIKPGDHIYSWRTAYAYAHHGIYIGGNHVIHFTPIRKDSASTHQNSCIKPSCGFRKPGSGVVLSCLDCFMGSGSLYLFQYGLKPYVYIFKLRGGTCTLAKSDPPHKVVVKRAMYLLQNGFGHYRVARNNCEDFALYCKTSLLACELTGSSGQVSSWVNALLIVAAYMLLGKSFCAAIVVRCLN